MEKWLAHAHSSMNAKDRFKRKYYSNLTILNYFFINSKRFFDVTVV